MLFKALDLECGYMEILSHTKEWRGEKSDVLLEGGGDWGASQPTDRTFWQMQDREQESECLKVETSKYGLSKDRELIILQYLFNEGLRCSDLRKAANVEIF